MVIAGGSPRVSYARHRGGDARSIGMHGGSRGQVPRVQEETSAAQGQLSIVPARKGSRNRVGLRSYFGDSGRPSVKWAVRQDWS